MSDDPLPAPLISPDTYTEEYFRTGCMGSGEWERTGGEAIDPQYPGYAKLAGIRPGQVVVDLGCGRGEMLVAALEAGAERAIGVEYAAAAVELARQTLERHEVTDRAELHHGDARRVPVDDGAADLVTLLDVVEHLSPDELQTALTEARRILKPGGTVFVHTMPNRSIYEITYKLQRLSRPSRRRAWPADPRNEGEKAMHCNEQTVSSLGKALKQAGFDAPDVWLGEWMWTDFVPDPKAKATYHRLARFKLTERLGKGDLWARAAKR